MCGLVYPRQCGNGNGKKTLDKISAKHPQLHYSCINPLIVYCFPSKGWGYYDLISMGVEFENK